jgi:LuxR family transcriptional regulator, maltose regulon positive regulatory protein
VLLDFPGPLLPHDRLASWLLPAAEKLRSRYIDLAIEIGEKCSAQGDGEAARALFLRALDFYPDAISITKALVEGRKAM